MLEYDNSAFYYFGISMCVVYLIPTMYYSMKRILYGVFLTDRLLDQHNVRCEKELQKIRKLQSEKTKLKNIFTIPFLINLVMISVILYSMISMINLVKDDSEIKSFDPFAILDIATGASDKDIKRAYRKMSLLYHPDKNIGDTIAEGKFMMVAKAYEALTDEVAKSNYEKYGNPDGRQALQLSIGLPTFFLKPENHKLILFIYLLVLVCIIPACVALWYTKSKKYGDSMIKYDTYGFYNFALSDGTLVRTMPEIVAGSVEYRELISKSKSKNTTSNELANLMKKLKQHGEMAKIKYNHPSILKGNVLLHAHVCRHELSSALKLDLQAMLKICFHLIDGMFEIASMKLWLQTTVHTVEFMQCMTQGLWIKDSSLLQLPNFTDNEVKHCGIGKNAMKNIGEFIRAAPSVRKGMNNFTDEERDEVNRVCTILPNVQLEVTASVEDEECIAEGDMLTIAIKMTRLNVEEGQTCDLVYAPNFPFPKAERWFGILGDLKRNRIYGIAKVTGQERVSTSKIMLQAPTNAGTYSFDFLLMSDSYLGLDQRTTIKVSLFSVINCAMRGCIFDMFFVHF